MSDSPPTSPDIIDDDQQPNGGWHEPNMLGGWREPEPPQEVVQWSTPILPAELDEEPVQEGLWHRPKSEDTIFTPDDEVEIKSPEDSLMAEPAATTESAGDAEDAEAEEEAPLAPEDLIYRMEHIEDDDDESVHMSELLALATLADDVDGTEHGEDAPLLADRELLAGQDEDSEDISDKLSATERAFLQRPGDVEEVGFDPDVDETEALSDPAEYARRQLAELGGAADDGDTDSGYATGPVEAEFDPNDPGAYARQQLAQLGGTVDDGDTGSGYATGPVEAEFDPNDPGAYARQQLAQLGGDAAPAQAPQTAIIVEPLDPHQQEMAEKFQNTQEQVRSLRAMVQSGQISQQDFIAQLQNMMILDDDHTWWMMGVETDQWYRSENNAWIPDEPPPLVALREYEEASRQQQSSQVMDDSLPYLSDDSSARFPSDPYRDPYDEYTPETPGDIRLDADGMPLPRRNVPLEDPDYTVPSAGIFDGERRDPDATVPGQSYYDPTMMAEPVDYGTIEAPFDETEPPDYDSLQVEGGELYEEVAEEQRQTVLRIVALVAVIGTGIVFLAAAGFVALALLWYNGIVEDWESGIAGIAAFEPEFQTVRILDRDGDEIATLAREGDDRRPVPLEEISPYMLHAVISLENRTFYSDPGWDLFRILSAFGQNVIAGDIESGASTITQQVARNLILQDTATTTERKVNEIIVAGELTRRYSKSEILELYLNEVAFFGNQTYGVEAAAQFYFNKPASELTLPESALLASIIQSPANNEPVNNRQTAFDLMRATMNRMAEVGCINFEHQPPTGNATFCVDQARVSSDQTTVEVAMVEARGYRPRQFTVRYPHFTQLVQAQLENLFGATEVYRGGYVVTTTLDSSLQDSAQEALVERVNALSTTGVNTGSVMVTDPRNGAILALVGSPDFNNADIGGQVDGGRTFQQPGSAIKPILYAAALQGLDRDGSGSLSTDEYYTPATILWDVQTSFSGAPANWPRNFDGRTRGPVSVRSALQNSLNIPAVKVMQYFGVDHFRAVAESMGLRFAAEAEFTLATALGATEVRLYDMMIAYGTIANNGQQIRLFTIESIVDRNGNQVPLPARDEPVQALRPQIAYLMQNILSDDQARAGQFGLNSALTISGLPTQNYIGAKTGTTDGNRDLWTMGFTNNRVVGVWLGTYDDAETVNNTGFTAAAPVWNRVMREALQASAPRAFQPPSNVVSRPICVDTGTLPGDTCANQRNEFFASSHPPPSADQAVAGSAQIDSWSGLRANEFCPDNVIESTFVRISDSAAIQWINNTSQGQAYAARIGLSTPVASAPEQACNQNTPIPVGRIASPSGGQTVQGSVPVTGQVSAENFNRYQIEYAPQGSDNFQIIGNFSTTQQPNAGSTLATWDTTNVPNGNYTLRLAMFSNEGGFLYRTADVAVNNPEPTATPIPTNTPIPTPAPAQPTTEPLPFDPVDEPPLDDGPTPTIDPLGG